MNFSKRLLIAGYKFPTIQGLPANYTTELIIAAEGGQYKTYTVPADGFYRVDICGGGGQAAGGDTRPGGQGGATNQIIYMYEGQKCLLWAGRTTTLSTSYPGPQTSEFGGRGASGYTGDESGGGGGGPAINGSGPGYEGGTPGAGSGFLAGFDDRTFPEQAITVGSLTRSINYAKDTSAINFTSIVTYIMAGGGGGGVGDNGGNRSGGGGGGAMGNGGTTYLVSVGATNGPAGTWGKGQDGGRYSHGAHGAWSIIDFSRARTGWNVGGGTIGANGYCRLYKVIPA